MANLNIGGDSHKEYLSNKYKNQNCFAYNQNSNTPTSNAYNINNISDTKKTSQEVYRSYLDAQVGYILIYIYNKLYRLRKKVIKII